MAGPFIFILIVFGIIIASVIPAFVSKLLMSAMFRRSVSFGMILLGMVLGTMLTIAAYVGMVWYTQGTFDPRNMPGIETGMTPAENALLWLFSFMLQVVVLTFIVPDQNLELIAGWKWAVVLILQYVVITLIVFAVVFLMANIGGDLQTSQILTRVV